MLRLARGSLTQGLVTILCIVGISWLALEYFVPSPPSRITIATGRKGTTFDFFGERYRERFARAGVKLDLRETAGALENLRLLQEKRPVPQDNPCCAAIRGPRFTIGLRRSTSNLHLSTTTPADYPI